MECHGCRRLKLSTCGHHINTLTADDTARSGKPVVDRILILFSPYLFSYYFIHFNTCIMMF